MKNIFIGFVLGVIMITVIYLMSNSETPERVPVRLEQPYFFLHDIPNDSLVTCALNYYGVKYPEIVLRQAKLETGNYKSINCKKNHNLFGLYNSRTKQYFKFKHWTESVEFYKNNIQRRYQRGDYYQFLENIGYAEDSLYIQKLKYLK